MTELRHFYSDDHSPFTINGKEVPWEKAMSLPVEEVLHPHTGSSITTGYHCIKREGIHFVGDLVSQAFHELDRIRNYGKQAHINLAARLAESGFCFPPHEACKSKCDEDCFYTQYWSVGERHLPLAYIKKLPLDNIRALDAPCYGSAFGDLPAGQLTELTPEEISKRIAEADLYYYKKVGALPPRKGSSQNRYAR